VANEKIVKWNDSVQFDVGVQNYTNQQVHEARMHPNPEKRYPAMLREMYMKSYGYDITTHGIPYTATVLKVLVGTNASDSASTNSSNSTCISQDNIMDRPPSAKKIEKVKLIARIPEFDTGLNFPSSEEDFLRICAHGEYHSRVGGVNVDDADVGDIIHVALRGKNSSPADGREAGYIVGFVSKASLKGMFARIDSPKIAFAKPCKSERNLLGAPPKYLRGKTDRKPVKAYPIIEKYKTRIKTGLYGNGTPQTKHHFIEALTDTQKTVDSYEYGVPGPAPGKENAFIWVGHLRNNGYLDLLDRPIGLGRETIIYAPMTLDTSIPIEIKYYFHDRAGFGHAWVNGPDTTTEEAKSAARTDGNDFKEKIAPAIKDLIKDRRNFILVIPEMAYSRGFGTKSNNATRTQKMSVSKRVKFSSEYASKTSAEIIRNGITKPEVISAVKEYLRGLPVGQVLVDWAEEVAIENVLQKTHLRERETVTFDGSFTGGLFGDFHIEVLEVIKNHLGASAFGNIEYVSILADGLGAINLASITKFMVYSGVHNNAEASFKYAPINRIDYVESSKDMARQYSFSNIPPYSIYRDYLLDKAEGVEYTEFNYITEVGSTHGRGFFNALGHGSLFDSSNTSPGSKGNKKFSLDAGSGNPPSTPLTPTDDQFSNAQALINMHTVPNTADGSTNKKVGYAFTMRSTFQGATNIPSVRDSNMSQTPINDYVPDHAAAATERPSSGQIYDYKNEKKKLDSKLAKFANNPLWKLAGKSLCDKNNPENKNMLPYCRAGKIYYGGDGLLVKKFKEYLNDIEKYWRLVLLIQNETDIAKIVDNRKQLESRLKEVEESIPEAKENNASKDFFNQELFPDLVFNSAIGAGSNTMYTIPTAFDRFNKPVYKGVLPHTVAKEEFFMTQGTLDKSLINGSLGAYAKIIYYLTLESALEETKERLITAIGATEKADSTAPDPACDPAPVSLANLVVLPRPSISNSRFSEQACSDIKVVSNFKELQAMLPWPGNDEPVTWEQATSNKKYTSQKSRIKELTEGYKTKKFKYKTRGKINPIYRESPPVWSCISNKIQESWEAACNVSNYIPFRIHSGIKGEDKQGGVTAYNSGMSIDTFGLSINVDPPLAGYSGDGKPVYSVFTGMWTPGFVETASEELYDLGVLYYEPSTLSDSPLGLFTSGGHYLDNAYESGFYYVQDMSEIELAEGHGELQDIGLAPPTADEGPHLVTKPMESDQGFVLPEPKLVPPSPRTAENWSGAEDSYDGPGGEGEKTANYNKIMKSAKGQLIIPPDANPVVWLLTFCERSGMKWGNSYFLRKKFRGVSQIWTPSEQKRIATIYGIPDIVARINAISWPISSVDKHMHFQYYAGTPIITWKEIKGG